MFRGYLYSNGLSGTQWYASRVQGNATLYTFDSMQGAKKVLEALVQSQYNTYLTHGYTAFVIEDDGENVRVASFLKFTPAPLTTRWLDKD